MKLERLPDWDIRLYAFLDSIRNVPYKIGTHDCAMFCAAEIYAITGVDLSAEYRGTYSTEEEYKAILQSSRGLTGLVTSYLGTPGPPKSARRGDIVLLKWKELEAIGVCLGVNVAFSTDKGLDTTYTRGNASLAWRVG